MILNASERDALEFLRTVFEKANDMFTVVDTADLHYVEANEVAERMLGYTREEIRALTVLDLHVPEDHSRIADIRARLDKDGQLRTTLTYRRKDGLRFPVEVSLCRIRVGERLLTLNIARDITERVRDIEHIRRQSEELSKARSLMEAVQERASDAFFLADEDGRYVFVNRRALAILGREHEEVIGRHYREFTPPSLAAGIEERWQRVLGGETVHYRVPLGAIQIDCLVNPVDWDGRRYVFSVVRDVTEEVRRESALEEAKGFLEALREHATDGLSIVDETGKVFYVNSRQAAMIGRTRDEVIGHHYSEFIHPDHLALAAEQVEGALVGREMHNRIKVPHPDGRVLVLEASSVRVEWGGRRLVFSSTRDVSGEVRQAEELAQAKGFLEAIQEHAQDAVFLSGEDGRLIFLNAAAVKFMGRRHEDVVGRHFNDFSPPHLKEKRAEEFRRILQGGSTRVRERMHRPDGRILEVDIVSSRVQWGGRNYVVSAVRDITDAVITENSLRHSRERIARQQAALVAITQSDAFQSADLATALHLLTETVSNALGVQRVGVWRFAGDRRSIRCADLCVEGVHSEGVTLQASEYPSYFAALEETEVIAADDAQADSRTCEFTKDYLKPAGITSMMDAPFHLRGRLDGVLCCEHIGPRREWYPDEKTFAVAMSNLVSLALGRWEQRRLEKRLEAQYGASRVLAEARTVEDAAPLLLSEIGRCLGWIVGAMWLVDEQAGLLRCKTVWAADGFDAGEFGRVTASRTFAPGVGLPGRIWSTRRPVWIPDVTRDDNFPRAPFAIAAGLHGAFGFPITLGGRVVGVIEFFHREVLEPDEALLQVTDSIGSQVGQFIQRKRAEEELRFQKTLLETQTESGIEGILLVDQDGRIISFNRAFRDIWAVPDNVLAQRSDEAAIASVLDRIADPAAFIARVQHLYAHPEETSRDEIALKDGRVVDRYSAPLKAADGTFYGRIWFFRDISDRKETKRAYEELKRAQAQLVQSEKLASVGMLVSGVAHEINNPINVIYGNLRLLKEQTKKPDRVVKQMIGDALRAADEARSVIDVFRNFARDSRVAEPCDVNRCIKDTLDVANRWLKGVQVKVTAGRLPMVPCFPGQLNQVILNLVKNAAEAMAHCGAITIRTFRRGRWAVIEVADTGPGIPASAKAKIFDPFFTTKASGMGLGLSISASIIEHHGGRLKLLKTSKRGTTFRVELPIAARRKS